MAKAAELLQDTTIPILAIALEVGYDNPSKFTTIFKRTYLETPLQYRKNLKITHVFEQNESCPF